MAIDSLLCKCKALSSNTNPIKKEKECNAKSGRVLANIRP
jgi:hypothetical protein